MSAPVGPSFFQDVSTCIYNLGTALHIYAVGRISVNRDSTLLKGKDNTKKRPVAVHEVEVGETITIETEDVNALNTLLLTAPIAVNLTFTAKAFSTEALTTTPLGDQSVTIKSLVLDRRTIQMPSKGIHSGSISGFCLEQSDGSDPIVFA